MLRQIKKYSTISIWIIHFFGIIGISFWDRDLFLSLTPLNLFISFAFLLLHQPNLNIKQLSIFFFIGSVGFFAEFLGVNYGLIFGSYQYGENLGYKVAGVPIMIGVNWAMLTIAFGAIWRQFLPNKTIAALMGAISMVALDYLIEPSASSFDFWHWENDVIPLQNFIGWFLVSIPVHFIYQSFSERNKPIFAYHLVAVQFIFFGVFFFINA